MLWEGVYGAAGLLLQGPIRNLAAGIHFKYKTWQGSKEFLPGKRYRMLVTLGGFDFGPFKILECGLFTTSVVFVKTGSPKTFKNRAFKNFHRIPEPNDLQPMGLKDD